MKYANRTYIVGAITVCKDITVILAVPEISGFFICFSYIFFVKKIITRHFGSQNVSHRIFRDNIDY